MERSRSQIMNQETMIEFDNPDFIVLLKKQNTQTDTELFFMVMIEKIF